MSIDFPNVRARHPLADVARRTGLDVPTSSGDYKVCCPMPDHDDPRPSMVLHLRTDRFHCFGCGAHGDVIEWVRSIYRVSVSEAVGMLDAGGSFPPILSRSTGLPNTRATARPVSGAELPDLNRTSAERVREALAEAWSYYSYARLHDEGSNYLQNRGIFVVDLETELGRPVVGHTPHKSPDQLIVRLKEKGFTDDELVDAGLARRTPGRPTIDAFRDRVVVPLRDGTGGVVGFIGRYDGTRDDVPKYLNCTKTITYDKSVNLYRPSRHTLDPDAQVIVCEGTLDALAIAATAASVGLSAKFAPVVESGLAISDAQWETILAIHPGSIVLCADGDEAGRRANAQWAAELVKRGRESVITFWPDGEDPASYLAKHACPGLASITRAEARRPLDDPCRRRRTYPVPADFAQALLLTDLATRTGRLGDLSDLQPLSRFGQRKTRSHLRRAADAARGVAPDALFYTSRTPNAGEANSRYGNRTPSG
ncbi:CHC2 zinc finger domain-containing protein [Ferrimicrobium acidiphilum]|uniref:DNA primase n=1 Tax=Ferrimicrobium acidiphilum DSM 19497 TaxID=1121877 RepID=A0A0D8FR39_9ACTN|nr:CHC2 zinc finger domain-containing protein [Ferrimicrobium acidiphilum]KJE75720.1 DNA primase [Ferrimicrobium acidiphilum DSM 19497]